MQGVRRGKRSESKRYVWSAPQFKASSQQRLGEMMMISAILHACDVEWSGTITRGGERILKGNSDAAVTYELMDAHKRMVMPDHNAPQRDLAPKPHQDSRPSSVLLQPPPHILLTH